jgi:hypothetical protein
LALWLFRFFRLIDPIPWPPVGKNSFGAANLARAPLYYKGIWIYFYGLSNRIEFGELKKFDRHNLQMNQCPRFALTFFTCAAVTFADAELSQLVLT